MKSKKSKDVWSEPPSCYGSFWCPDDCVCSCPWWEDCMLESEERERELEEDYGYKEDDCDGDC